jgi:hypothetical protein
MIAAWRGPAYHPAAARSMRGFARWRLQRELWRRDVERLEVRDR